MAEVLYNVVFADAGVEIKVREGMTLLQAAIFADIHPDAPCGGNGTCNKCKMKIISGKRTGVFNACQVRVDCDMVVESEIRDGSHHLLMKGSTRNIKVKPAVFKLPVDVEKCTIGDNISEWDRLKNAAVKALKASERADAGKERIIKPAPQKGGIVSRLGDRLLQAGNKGEVIMFEGPEGFEILDFGNGITPFAVAFDIGTTSIVGYMIDALTGKEVAVRSLLNPQAQFGADVINRSNYAIANGYETVHKVVCDAMNRIIRELCEEAGTSPENVYAVSFAGNTCMHHLFMDFSVAPLVHAPYNPSFADSIVMRAGDNDILINASGKLIVLPNIAGFVGADTVACLLATDFDRREKLTLMIDIGTNGEMVLGNSKRRITCSTAAGPAFEGAKITCGMRGAAGAIDHLDVVAGKLEYSTIDNEPAKGICGSGLMDLIALMLDYGIIDDGGRLVSEDEYDDYDGRKLEDYTGRFFEHDGKNAFMIGNGVFICQKDIREVQLAKAAISAGIILMSDRMGISIIDIGEVFIAGAFGNYMRAESACRIGMIPESLLDRIKMIGNAAGEGSKIALLNVNEFERTDGLARGTEFLELATHEDFNDTFVDELSFE